MKKAVAVKLFAAQEAAWAAEALLAGASERDRDAGWFLLGMFHQGAHDDDIGSAVHHASRSFGAEKTNAAKAARYPETIGKRNEEIFARFEAAARAHQKTTGCNVPAAEQEARKIVKFALGLTIKDAQLMNIVRMESKKRGTSWKGQPK